MADNFDRIPPHSIEAERCLLASMMLDKDVVDRVVHIVDRDAFYQADHQILYDIIVKLYESNRPTDTVIVREELIKRQLLDEVGGTGYLAQLLNTVPSAAHGMHYANIVREKAMLRKVIALCDETLRDAFAETSADVLVDRAQYRLFNLDNTSSTESRAEELLHAIFEKIESRGQRGIETGFIELDEMLNGLQRGELIIIAGRPGIGKTAFAANIIERAAREKDLSSAVFTTEMSKEQFTQRMLCSVANVDGHGLRKGALTARQFQDLAVGVGELAKAPIFVASVPNITIGQLCKRIRRTVKNSGVRLVMVDWTQRIEAEGQNTTEQLTLVSRRLKALAMELEIPIIAVSQLNRGMFQPSLPRPRLEDLRGSGTLEEDADVVILLHREDYYRRHEPNFVPDNLAEVTVAKQRNGPTGTFKLIFDEKRTRFRNLSAAADPF